MFSSTKKEASINIKAMAGKERAAESMVLRKLVIEAFLPGKAPKRKTKGEKTVERRRVTYLVIRAKKIFRPVPKRVKAKIRGIKLAKKFSQSGFPLAVQTNPLMALPKPMVINLPIWSKMLSFAQAELGSSEGKRRVLMISMSLIRVI